MKALSALLITPHSILTALILFISIFSYGQTKTSDCNCPKTVYAGSKPDTIFRLSNGKSIALCGYRDKDINNSGREVYFSEFVLSACGEKKIIKFWGALQICHLRIAKDTLIVETMVELPTGKGMAFKWTVWTIEHIYFSKGNVITDFNVNRRIGKYNKKEIESSFSQYQHAKKEPTDANMEILEKLFMSAISGSQKARTYITDFKQRFSLDGEYAEWYDDVMRRLNLWDTNVVSKDMY